MKVLLIIPNEMKQGPAMDVPCNMLYLLSALRNAKIDAKLADGNLIGRDGVRAMINEYQPDIAGISCLSPVRFNALFLAQCAKEAGAKVIMGNHHAHWMYEQVLKNYSYIDACAFGEGEQTIVDFATKPMSEVLDIAYREGGEIVKTAAKKRIPLDDIAFPAWDLVDWEAYRTKNAIGPRMYFSRGCFGRCKFCLSPKFWRGYRFRSVNNFCDEAEWLYQLGKPEMVFGDDNANNEKSIDLFTEIYNRKGHICLPVQVVTRVDTITPELCKLMREVGVQEVCLGVESASQRMLDHFGKDVTVEQNQYAVNCIKQSGMRATALVIRNSISETPDDKWKTQDFMNRNQPIGDGSVNALWLFPYTKYWDEILEGKYDQFIHSGKELVNLDFYLDPRWAQHVLAFCNGKIYPTKVTEC